MKAHNQEIMGVTCDSREVKPGYAFVAIQGFEDDGNKYINEAIKSGAKVIYTEQDIDDLQVPVVKVNNARKRLAKLANQLYDAPSQKLDLIGVTGTNGKTTTTHLIESIFSNNNFKSGLIGTVNIKIDNQIQAAKLTTPDAVTISNYLSKMVDVGVNVAVMEVSSHGLKLNRVSELDFDFMIYTNLSRDHLDLHEDFEEYLSTKKELFSKAAADKLALINIDDSQAEVIKSGLKCRVVSYGFSEQADIRAEVLDYNTRGSRFKVLVDNALEDKYGNQITPGEFELKLQLLGQHNIYNALAAAATGLLFALNIEEIKRGLESFKPFFRRLETVYANGFTVIDDCAHNPGSYEAVFKSLMEIDYNNLYLVNAIRGNRGLTVNRENAEVISSFLPELERSELYISSCEKLANRYDLVSTEEKELFIEILNSRGIEFEYFAELGPCLSKVLNKVQAGDLVVLLGAHAMDQAAKITLEIIKNKNK